MLKFKDYFSRRVLFKSGISLNETLAIKGENEYIGADRKQKILADMSKIYSTFINGLTNKNVQDPQGQVQEMGIDKKIVSAFYDSGAIEKGEIDFFKNQNLFAGQEKEKISVLEAQENTSAKVSEKIEPSISVPIKGSVKQ